MSKLGLHIREKRLNYALNQQELAKKIGITSVTLSKIENGGRCGTVVLKKLSAYLGISTKLLREMMVNKVNEDNQ